MGALRRAAFCNDRLTVPCYVCEANLLTQWETTFAATDMMKLISISMFPPPPAAGVGGDSTAIIPKSDSTRKCRKRGKRVVKLPLAYPGGSVL